MIELLLQAERALSVGLLDRAETLYRQVAAADPRNSIAVVGLARVAIERGDEDGALELGRRALEIDPENSAAQRLVQRLEEVRAHRRDSGRPPPRPPAPKSIALEPARERPVPPPAFVLARPTPESNLSPGPSPARPPETAPARDAETPVAASAPPAGRRSWLDRLLRRNR